MEAWSWGLVLALALAVVAGVLMGRLWYRARTSMADWSKYFLDNPNAVLRISASGKILFANPAASVLLEHWRSSRGNMAPPELVDAASRAARQEKPQTLEVPHKQGILSLMVCPVPGQDYLLVFSWDITRLREVQKDLAAAEAGYRAIYDSVHDAIMVHDAETGAVVEVNKSCQEMFGYTASEFMGMSVGQVSSGREPFTQEKALESIHDAAAGKSLILDWHARDKNGRLFWAEVSLKQVDIQGVKRVAAVIRDVESRQETRRQLQLYGRIIDNSTEGIMVTNPEGVIEMVNPAFTDITGYTYQEALGGNPRILKSGRHGPDFYRRMWQDLQIKGQWRGELWNRRKNGEAYPQWLNITAIKDSGGRTTHYLGMFRDITDIKASEERIKRQAYHDPLTGLPNRLLLTDRLRMALARAQRSGSQVAVFFTDLDGFKQVNDTLGHATGDLLLIEVARRLMETLREEDTVSRQGGDEFVVVLPDVSQAGYAEVAARRVLSTVRESYRLEGAELSVTTSLGIAMYPSDGADAELLLRRADEAMYRAKKAGKNTFRFWSDTSGPGQDYATDAREASF